MMKELHEDGQNDPTEEYGYALENPYVIDPDLLEEMYRVDLQGRILTEAMGSLLPARPDGAPIEHVLDLACGSAEWVRAVARSHPEIQLVGLDKAPRMIEFAKARAYADRLPNATFQIADVSRPLTSIRDATFDLVNARLMQGFLKTHEWLPLVKECWRVLRPGGVLRLTETEGQFTNSVANEQHQRLFTRALHAAGMSFSKSGESFGMTFMLRSLLHEAGFRSIQEQAHVVNTSYGSPAYQNTFDNATAAMPLLLPFIVRTLTAGQAPEEAEQFQREAEQIALRATQEMQDPGFRGVWLLLSAIGEKP